MPRNLSTADIEDFRDRLCDVAEPMFAEHGAESVTIRQLAGALGVSPMTPYRYFKDKDAILAAVRARAFERHAEALEGAYQAHPDDPVRRGAAVGQAYISFALEHPQAYKLMFDIQQPNAGDYPELVRSGDRSRATMTRYVQELVAAGVFHGDPDLIGHLFWAALHGPLMLHFSGMLPAAFDAATLIGGLVDALTRALIETGPTGEQIDGDE